jgi:CubicO group peptidase (beta-lactamase class C family)
MRHRRWIFRAHAVIAAVLPIRVAAQTIDSLTPRVDAIMGRYTADAPGCATGVYQNGRIIFAKGYGQANLEYRTPITSATPFIVGSVSKQFTAAAIALLVEDGRISLSDGVRKYVPELRDYGKPITVGQLVHHTSGLRDFWTLVSAAAMRNDDGYTANDILQLASRQRNLNFDPGAEYLYSNTGYVVLGIIVQRVTGKSLRDFSAERIFGPLGMTSSHYHDDHTMPVPGRASAYSPLSAGGWRINVWNNDIVGQGGVMTTVEDLAKWDENFYTGRVGGARFLARQLERGTLNDGTTLAYAFGLQIGEYRGLPMVEHTGSSGGYRAVITRFPSTHTSIVALCNVSTAETATLSHRVADAVLGARFTKPVPPSPVRAAGATQAATAVVPSDLGRFAGRYYSEELDATYEVTPAARTLIVRRPRGPADTLQAADPTTFRGGGMTLRFPGAGSPAPSFMAEYGRVRGIVFVRR